MVEEAVWHHGHSVLDGHPAAEGQVHGDLIRAWEIEVDAANWWLRGELRVSRFIVVSVEVVVWDQVSALRDVREHEVPRLCLKWLPWKIHFTHL